MTLHTAMSLWSSDEAFMKNTHTHKRTVNINTPSMCEYSENMLHMLYLHLNYLSFRTLVFFGFLIVIETSCSQSQPFKFSALVLLFVTAP